MLLCFLILADSVFVSMYYVDVLYLPVLAEWHYVVDVLWGPVAQTSWSPELDASEQSLV